MSSESTLQNKASDKTFDVRQSFTINEVVKAVNALRPMNPSVYCTRVDLLICVAQTTSKPMSGGQENENKRMTTIKVCKISTTTARKSKFSPWSIIVFFQSNY